MKQLRAMTILICLLSTPHFALGCYDPVLSTNTSPQVLKGRYRAIRAASESKTIHKCRSARADSERGARALFGSKEARFLYPNLFSQYQIPCLAPLMTNYDRLPKKKCLVTTVWHEKRLNVSVQILGRGTNNTVLVCIPGVMSDSTVFRFLVGALANDYEFWLIDPPGCGESEAPSPKDLGPGGYSPAALAERELQTIEACTRDRPKDIRILIVAHSLGGLVAVRAFGDPQLRERYAHVLSRIEGLVLLAPADVFMSQVSPALVSRADLSGLTIRIGNGLGVVPEAVAEYLVGSFYASHCMPREEVDHAVAVLSNPGTRNAFQAMLHEALAFDRKTQRPNFLEMMAQEKWYRNIDLPCEIIWGKCDQTVPVYVGYMLEHQLPNASLTVIPDCKHAPLLECPSECAQLIREADVRIASKALARERLTTARAD